MAYYYRFSMNQEVQALKMLESQQFPYCPEEHEVITVHISYFNIEHLIAVNESDRPFIVYFW